MAMDSKETANEAETVELAVSSSAAATAGSYGACDDSLNSVSAPCNRTTFTEIPECAVAYRNKGTVTVRAAFAWSHWTKYLHFSLTLRAYMMASHAQDQKGSESEVEAQICGHKFHKECIKQYSLMQAQRGQPLPCPVCRAVLPYQEGAGPDDVEDLPEATSGTHLCSSMLCDLTLGLRAGPQGSDPFEWAGLDALPWEAPWVSTTREMRLRRRRRRRREGMCRLAASVLPLVAMNHDHSVLCA